MAANFKISVHRHRNRLSLSLIGDFDGSSAYELLHVLERNCNGVGPVLIDTHGLKHIYPFGLDVFYNNFHPLNGRSNRIVFKGENAAQLAQEQIKE